MKQLAVWMWIVAAIIAVLGAFWTISTGGRVDAFVTTAALAVIGYMLFAAKNRLPTGRRARIWLVVAVWLVLLGVGMLLQGGWMGAAFCIVVAAGWGLLSYRARSKAKAGIE